MLAAFAFMGFAMLTAAFSLSMLATAFMVIPLFAGAGMMGAGVILAVVAIPMAATAAGAGAHLLVHGLSHLFIAGGSALFDSQAEVLIHHGKHIIEHLAGLQESLAQLILHHGRTQLIKLIEFLFRRRHSFHMLVAQSFAIFANLAEQIGCFGVLIKKAYAGFGCDNFLATCKSTGQFTSHLCQFWGKGGICHNARRLAYFHAGGNAVMCQKRVPGTVWGPFPESLLNSLIFQFLHISKAVFYCRNFHPVTGRYRASIFGGYR